MFSFPQGEESSSTQTVFAICLQAEQVPATVQDYREKLLHLRKLRHDLVQPCLPQGPFQQVQNVGDPTVFVLFSIYDLQMLKLILWHLK